MIQNVFEKDHKTVTKFFIGALSQCTNPILMTFFGAERNGKSTFASDYLKIPGIFPSADGDERKTVGAWFYGPVDLQGFAKKHNLNTDLKGQLIIIDTEGLYTLKENKDIIPGIQALLHISTVRAFVCVKKPDVSVQERVQTQLHLNECIKLVTNQQVNIPSSVAVICQDIGIVAESEKHNDSVDQAKRRQIQRITEQLLKPMQLKDPKSVQVFAQPTYNSILAKDETALRLHLQSQTDLTQFVIDSSKKREVLPGEVYQIMLQDVCKQFENGDEFSDFDLKKSFITSIQKPFQQIMRDGIEALGAQIHDPSVWESREAVKSYLSQVSKLDNLFDQKILECVNTAKKQNLWNFIKPFMIQQYDSEKKIWIERIVLELNIVHAQMQKTQDDLEFKKQLQENKDYAEKMMVQQKETMTALMNEQLKAVQDQLKQIQEKSETMQSEERDDRLQFTFTVGMSKSNGMGISPYEEVTQTGLDVKTNGVITHVHYDKGWSNRRCTYDKSPTAINALFGKKVV